MILEKELIYEVTFDVSPSLKQSEEIDGFTFVVNQYSQRTFVTRTQSLKARCTQQEKRILIGHRQIEEAFKQDKGLIRKLLLRNMLYQKNYRTIEIKTVGLPVLTNEKEISDGGITINYYSSTDIELINIRLDDEIEKREYDISLSAGEKYWKLNLTNYEDDLMRIATWLERSQTATNSIDKFMHIWIAFNSLFNLYIDVIEKQEINSERKRFKLTVEKLISASEARDIITNYRPSIMLLASYDFVTRNGKACSPNLKSNLLNRSILLDEFKLSKNELLKNKLLGICKQILNETVDCIYCIRNQAFHDAPQSLKLANYTEETSALLLEIVSTCTKNFITLTR
jgi:hypothetical protein